MSGSKCFDTVSDAFVESFSGYIRPLWQSLVLAVATLLNDDGLHRELDKAPEPLWIRTPRAYAYSFRWQGKDYLVLDEHFHRLAHRWFRLAERRAGDVAHPGDAGVPVEGHFEDLFSERYFVAGDLVGCAKSVAAGHVYGHGGFSDFAPFDDEQREETFQMRSTRQHLFLFGHEMAHVLLRRIDEGSVDDLAEALLAKYRSGFPSEESLVAIDPAWRVDPVLARIRGSRYVMIECLCDALSLSALYEFRSPRPLWENGFVAASDSLNILHALRWADMVCRVNFQVFLGVDETEVGTQLEGAEGLADLVLVRKVALMWLASAWERQLEAWGPVFSAHRGASLIDAADSQFQELFSLLCNFSPGAILDREGILDDDDVAHRLAHALMSRDAAYRSIGFADPIPHTKGSAEAFDA
jgi:hypothetical protein